MIMIHMAETRSAERLGAVVSRLTDGVASDSDAVLNVEVNATAVSVRKVSDEVGHGLFAAEDLTEQSVLLTGVMVGSVYVGGFTRTRILNNL